LIVLTRRGSIWKDHPLSRAMKRNSTCMINSNIARGNPWGAANSCVISHGEVTNPGVVQVNDLLNLYVISMNGANVATLGLESTLQRL
jgi:hypothetical protein